MKKIFTLIGALVGFASLTSAATVDDIVPLKHSYVLVGDDYTNNGTEKVAKGILFGDDHFFTPTGHDKATNKGSVDLSTADELGIVTEEIVAKYKDYGTHLNSLRLKTSQDVFAMKVTAGSKVIIFFEKNKDTDVRYPIIAKDASLSEKLTSEDNVVIKGEYNKKQVGRFEWTADDDYLVYVGAENQIFLSYVIIEAKEAEGTPQVKVGPQSYEGGLWFKEVTCTPGLAYGMPTDVYYTTDGSEPTVDSKLYTEPIKCYADMTVKFQAFMAGIAVPDANNEANVNFAFDAPAISAEGASVSIVSPYEGAKNFYTINGGEAQEGSSFTLTESATVSAYSQIVNGSYATFTTKSTSQDVYVLNPIKEKKVITVSGTAVLDEEATATSTTGEVYKIEGGAITADKADFFVKNLTFAALANADAVKSAYQVPAGQEAYIQMSNTNITFQVAEGDSVTVKVVCSKNSCKNLDADDAAEDKLDNGCTPDRQCYVNVSGTNYCLTDAEGLHTNDLKLYPDANVFEFGLNAGTHTFQKYSGTGNILISSIEITPAAKESGISTIVAAEAQSGTVYNLAGQKVNVNFKGMIIMNGKKMLQK